VLFHVTHWPMVYWPTLFLMGYGEWFVLIAAIIWGYRTLQRISAPLGHHPVFDTHVPERRSGQLGRRVCTGIINRWLRAGQSVVS